MLGGDEGGEGSLLYACKNLSLASHYVLQTQICFSAGSGKEFGDLENFVSEATKMVSLLCYYWVS